MKSRSEVSVRELRWVIHRKKEEKLVKVNVSHHLSDTLKDISPPVC